MSTLTRTVTGRRDRPATKPGAKRRSLSISVLAAAVLALVASACGNGLEQRVASGEEAYVANMASQADPGTTVATLNLQSKKAGAPVKLGADPAALALAKDSTRLLVANYGADTVSIVNTATNTAFATVKVGLEPDALAVDPAGDLALVADFGDGMVTPINLSDSKALPPIRVGNPQSSEPDAIAISANGNLALVADFGDGMVTPIELSGLKTLPPIRVPGGPRSIAVSSNGPSGPVAYVASGTSLYPINLEDLSVGNPIPVGQVAEAVAIQSRSSTAFVADEAGLVTPVNLRDGKAGTPIAVGGRPFAIVITSFKQGPVSKGP